MRIRLHDPNGFGLGLAIGLVELGHDVDYRPPRTWSASSADEVCRLAAALARRYCGAGEVPRDERRGSDLGVIVDAFADLINARQPDGQADPPLPSDDPLQSPHDPRFYPGRLRHWLDVARAAPRVAVVDMSDTSSPREVAFEQLPHATLFQREGVAGAGPWQPFPFLFNNVMLWLEHLRPEREWWVPPGQRRLASDWAFCGTVEHPRYGDRRRLALLRTAARWPRLRGAVAQIQPFVEVLRVIQSTRFSLDLPGAGQVCFRVHESLALGTPVLRPEPGTVAFAPGLEAVAVHDPAGFAGLDANAVREVYRDAGGPRAAARTLLAGCVVPRPLQLPTQTPVACVPPSSPATWSK